MNTSEVRFRTAEVAKLAEVSLRQLQLWEERRVAIASRSGRVRLYTASQALFVIVVAELRRRGLSFQRLRRLSTALRQLLDDHELQGLAIAFLGRVFFRTFTRGIGFRFRTIGQYHIRYLVQDLNRPIGLGARFPQAS